MQERKEDVQPDDGHLHQGIMGRLWRSAGIQGQSLWQCGCLRACETRVFGTAPQPAVYLLPLPQKDELINDP